MTNAQDIFNLAMAVIDELNERGAADTTDTSEYKHRTLQILNVLQGELYPYSDLYEVPVKGKRSIAFPILKFDEAIASLDDYICRTVLPYGLAAHLLMDENPAVASTCLQRYEELRAGLSKGMCYGSEEIEDVYGSFPHTEYGYWR
jgi:hypothetical protein